MTRKTNARLAGYTFLFYIAVGITSMMLSARAKRGDGVAAQLASIAQNATTLRTSILFNLLAAFSALVLAVTLRSLTRDVDDDIATFGLVCRVGEGVIGVFPAITLALLSLATQSTSTPVDAAATSALGGLLMKIETGQSTTAALLFSAGSTAFTWLLLRGRIVPQWMSITGVIASVLLVILLPLQLAGFARGLVIQLMWLPMLVFEVSFAFWLIFKGAELPARSEVA